MHRHYNWISCTMLCINLVWGADFMFEDSHSNTGPCLVHHLPPDLIKSLKANREKRKTPKQNLIFWEQCLNKQVEKQKGTRSHAAKGGENKSHGEYRVHVCFPCVCFNHSSLYLVRRSANLRRCDENKVAVSARLCCLAAFLSVFFFEGFFPPLSYSCCQDKDVTPQTGTTKKKKSLCSQPAKVVIDGRLNKTSGRKAHFLPSFEGQKPLS